MQLKTILHFTVLTLLLHAASPVNADLIGVAWDFEDSPVYRIDETTGAAELIGYSGLSHVNSLAQDSRGILYTVGFIDTGTEPVYVLATIDPLTGRARPVGPLTGTGTLNIRSMAFSPEGTLYAYSRSGHKIIAINPVTAEFITVADLFSDGPGVHSLQGLEFAPNGMLFGWGSSQDGRGLVLIDPLTGLVVNVDPTIIGPPVQALVFAEDGTLFGHYDSSRYCPPLPFPFPCTEVIEGTLLMVNPFTGAPTLVGTNIANEIRGLAVYRIPDIPEIPVLIDIKPGDDWNTINPDSRGVIPVAIFSSEEFDATTIDPATVLLAGAEVAVRGKGRLLAHVEDVNGDDLPDLVCQVETEGLTLDPEFSEVWLTGETMNFEQVIGLDFVVIVPDQD